MQNPRNFGRGPDFGGFNSFYKKNMPNCNLQYAIITQHKEMQSASTRCLRLINPNGANRQAEKTSRERK